MPVEKRQRRCVRGAGRERNTERFPESGELVGGAGGKGPVRGDALRVIRENTGRIRGRVGRDLEQQRGRGDALGELEKYCGVKRTGLMTARMKRRDDHVLAGNRRESYGVSRLIGELEIRHRYELAGELAESKVHLVVARIGGARDEMAGIDSEE